MRAAAGLAALCVLQAGVCAGNLALPLERPATLSPLASRVAVSGLALAGTRMVAVGERGIVQLSDDSGATWRQVGTPVSVTLTAVHFPAPLLGWAVGHAGVILHTADAGEHWTVQLDGRAAAAAAVKQAAEAGTGRPPEDAAVARYTAMARQLAEDGADKPFLDVYFSDAKRGMAVGAFGLIFGTGDGGKSWLPLMPRLDNPKGLHLYALRGRGEQLVIAGEQGFAARTMDGGKTFARIPTPYGGSYFAVSLLPSGDVLLAGLKGNLYYAASAGGEYRRAANPFPLSVNALAQLADGRVVAANQAGQLLLSDDAGRTLASIPGLHAGAPLSAVLQAPDGTIIGAGLRGVVRLAQTALPPIKR